MTFDQFEEFFLLRANAQALAAMNASSFTKKPPEDSPDEITSLSTFFHSFLANPPERVAILLAYRWDHSQLLAPMALPARSERLNHMVVGPLGFAEATRFLQSCPGLTIPEGLMQRALSEAAR